MGGLEKRPARRGLAGVRLATAAAAEQAAAAAAAEQAQSGEAAGAGAPTRDWSHKC